MREEVSVLGGGRMALSYAKTLRRAGMTVKSDTNQIVKTALLAFFSGRETLAFLRDAKFSPDALLIDLGTQSIRDALENNNAAREAQVFYLAGGVTGGARQVGGGEFTLLLGGKGISSLNLPWLSLLGTVKVFATIEEAVSAKLLHNLALVLINHSLGLVLDLAERAGIHDLVDVLEKGTAGRPIRLTSAIRDRIEGPSSSYTASLVAKDLRAILSTFPALSTLSGLHLAALADHYEAFGATSYTAVKPLHCREASA